MRIILTITRLGILLLWSSLGICEEENNNLLLLSNGEKVMVSSFSEIQSKIEAVHIEPISFYSVINNYCGKGFFLFNEDELDWLDPDQKYLFYTQYIEKNIEPTALDLDQNGNKFYLTLFSDETVVDKACQLKKGTNILFDALLVKAYSGNEQFNSIAITNFHVQ